MAANRYVKFLDKKYIPFVRRIGPILNPVNIPDSTYDILFRLGYSMEIVPEPPRREPIGTYIQDSGENLAGDGWPDLVSFYMNNGTS